MKHKVKCKLYLSFNNSKLPVAQVENLVYRWVFQNIKGLDDNGHTVETWTATVESTVVEDDEE